MSRTFGGYLFECKECGEKHLMASGKPRNGIRLPCVNNKKAIRKYRKKDFTLWMGSFFDVCDNIVREVSD